MTTKSRILTNESGFIFLTAVVSLFIMVLSGAMVYELTTQNVFTANYLQKTTQARYLAEAGLAQAFSVLKANWSSWNSGSNFPATTLGEGTFDASVSKIGTRYLVTSTGTVRGVTRQATAEVVPPPTTKSAFDYAISAGGSATIDSGTSSSPATVTGDIYAGGSFALDGASNGPKLTITGVAQAVGSISTNATVDIQGGPPEPNYTDTVIFPTPDLSYYYNIAYANRTSGVTYYNTSQNFSSGALAANPPGGVIYVNGSVTISGTQLTNACLVVTGSISIAKQGSTYPRVTINGYSNYPAIICPGSFSFSSTGNGGAYLTTRGLVYVGGSFSYSSGNHDTLSMTGPLTVRGSISLSPTAQNTSIVTWTAVNPPGFSSSNGGGGQMTIASYNT